MASSIYHARGSYLVSHTHCYHGKHCPQQLVVELAEGYQNELVFKILQRLFEDNYTLVEGSAQLKLETELNSACLQSVDDLEATFSRKGPAGYKGYVANLAETCDPENEVQLITSVQVASKNQDDAHLLAAALPDFKQRTGVEELYTYGGYGSPAVEKFCQAAGVTTAYVVKRKLYHRC